MSGQYRPIFGESHRDDLKTVDPWMYEKPNPLEQTGGDWYNILLSASLGNKIVHGVNTAPTMEVLGKAPPNTGHLYDLGRLTWDTNTSMHSKLGDRVSDQFYVHQPYRGGETATGALLAFDSSVWEPSIKARARSVSMLAAGIAAHGCSKQDALETTKIISADEVDTEAVDATILPASHLKREMTLVAKPTHRLFSQGTIQQGITWEDNHLTVRSGLPNIAYDWGRITTIARYIAEANVQICPKFRTLAKNDGIPYHIVRNAWAAVAAEDYNLPPSLFKDVPRLDIRKLGIPSLRGAYLEHEQEIMESLTRYMNTDTIQPSSEAFRGLAHIYRVAKKRQAKKRRITAARMDDIEEGLGTESLPSREVVDKHLQGVHSPWELIVCAVATRREHDPDFAMKVNRFLASSEEMQSRTVDNMSRATFARASWQLAKGEAQRLVENIEDEATQSYTFNVLLGQLSDLRSRLYNFKVHLDTPVVFTADMLDALRPITLDVLQESSSAQPIAHFTQQDILNRDMLGIGRAIAHLDDEGQSILQALQVEVADKFKHFYKLCRNRERKYERQNAINYYFTAHCMKSMSAKAIACRECGYVDGSNPKDTFVYRAVKKLTKKLNLKAEKFEQRAYADAKSIALSLREKVPCEYSFYEATCYALNIADEAVGDLLNGVIYEPPEDMVPEEDYIYSDQEDGPTKMMALAQEEAFMEDSFKEMMETYEIAVLDDFTLTQNTYPSVELAERYARLNGYENFRAAFNALGERASYLEDNAFCMLARERDNEEAEDGAIPGAHLGYQPML